MKELSKKTILLVLVGLPFLFLLSAEPTEANDETILYFFWARGCPHCEMQKPLLDELDEQHPELTVKDLEISGSRENRDLMEQMGEAYGITVRGVPVTFLGDRSWVGYTEQTGEEIRAKVEECITVKTCQNPLRKVREPESEHPEPDPEEQQTLNLPFFGPVDLTGLPALGSTALIAFVDGFNPCSLWVLTFLIGIVIHTRSRKKILIVGITFLTVTATAYGLFILGVFSVFRYIGQLFWIRLVVSLIAFTFGIFSVKDYFWFKKGISFTIPDEYKPKIGKKIRDIIYQDRSLLAVVFATGLLALGVTLVELPCTAGFPVIWTGMMSAANVSTAVFATLFVLYVSIYLLLELIIFIPATITLSSGRLQEKHGRVLKLIGGNLMLVLAGSFLFAPQLLYEMAGTAIVFGATVVGTVLLIFLYEIVLPNLKVYFRK